MNSDNYRDMHSASPLASSTEAKKTLSRARPANFLSILLGLYWPLVLRTDVALHRHCLFI